MDAALISKLHPILLRNLKRLFSLVSARVKQKKKLLRFINSCKVMSSLQQLKSKVLNLKGKEVELAVMAIKDNEAVLPDFVASQLAQGVMKDGKKSSFKYSPFTIAAKQGRSGLSGVTEYLTNYDTGESYRKLYARTESDKIVFGTRSNKEEDISKRMRGKAFGLTPENREEFLRGHAFPDFMKRIKQQLS